MAEAPRARRRHGPRPGLGIRARGRVRLRRARPPTISRPARPLVQQAAALLALFEAPHYFRRAGKGRFKKAPAEIIQQALAAHREEEAGAGPDRRMGRASSAAGECPAPVREQLFKILFKPDKNAPEYKAVVEAAARHAARAARAAEARPAPSTRPTSSTGSASCSRTSPRAPASRRCRRRPSPTSCRGPTCRPSRSTTRTPPRSTMRCRCRASAAARCVVGIHIAAPGLALVPGSPIDQVARARMSTVYMPGHKITMLPDAGGGGLHAAGRPRLPGRLALRRLSTKPRWR